MGFEGLGVGSRVEAHPYIFIHVTTLPIYPTLLIYPSDNHLDEATLAEVDSVVQFEPLLDPLTRRSDHTSQWRGGAGRHRVILY